MTWAERKARWLADPSFRERIEKEYPSLSVAEQIIRLRADRGWTQAELATAIGSHQSLVARVESGRNPITTAVLQRIADALGARVELALIEPEAEPEAVNEASAAAAGAPDYGALVTAGNVTFLPGAAPPDLAASAASPSRPSDFIRTGVGVPIRAADLVHESGQKLAQA
jgi:transcriptional regulator with XRE-family HTH domain